MSAKWTFLHEIGHNLGLNHNREVAHYGRDRARGSRDGYGYLSNPLAEHRKYPLFKQHWVPGAGRLWPYSLLPVDQLPTLANQGAFTIMAYDPDGNGRDWDFDHGTPPEDRWQAVPFFSAGDSITLHAGEHGLVGDPEKRWKLGYGRSDSVELMKDTVPKIARLSDWQYDLSLTATRLRVTNALHTRDGDMHVTLEWDDNSKDESAFQIRVWEVEERTFTDPIGTYTAYVLGRILPVRFVMGMPGRGRRSASFSWPSSEKQLAIRMTTENKDGPVWSWWAREEWKDEAWKNGEPGVDAVSAGRIGPVQSPECTPRFSMAVSPSLKLGEADVMFYLEDLTPCGHLIGRQYELDGSPVEFSGDSVQTTVETGREYTAVIRVRNRYGFAESDPYTFKLP